MDFVKVKTPLCDPFQLVFFLGFHLGKTFKIFYDPSSIKAFFKLDKSYYSRAHCKSI